MNKREKLRSLKVGEVFLPPEKEKKNGQQLSDK